MINKTNIIGWANLFFRLFLSLGMTMAVNYVYGEGHVKSWLVYITIIASIQAVDGLLSQYFLREILYGISGGQAGNLNRCLAVQNRIYFVVAVVFLVISAYSLDLGMEYALIFILMFVFVLLKVFDSRAKAMIDVPEFQKLELKINTASFFILGVVLYFFRENYYYLMAAHLACLASGMLIKRAVEAKSARNVIKPADTADTGISVKTGLWQSVVIAFGGSLSVNLGLLTLQSFLGDTVSSGFLLTYRIGALICEISSLPVIVRIPVITRHIAQGEPGKALDMFKSNYRVSIILCCSGFFMLTLGSQLWNSLLPKALNIETGYLVILIGLAWIFERVATLISQLLLSLKRYQVVRVYFIYFILLVCGIGFAVLYANLLLFPLALLLANVIVSVFVMKYLVIGFEK